MSIDKIIDFLKNNIWGLLIIGGLGSVLGSLLIYFSKKIYAWLARHYRVFRTKNYLRRLKRNYFEGYTAGMAATSDVKQTILIGRYLLHIILNSVFLIVILIVFLGVSFSIPAKFLWV